MFIPKMSPEKMMALMTKMGIKTEELNATKAVIELADGEQIVIENPVVTAIDMRGQRSFQIFGEIKEPVKELFTEKDVKMVVEKTGVSEDEARKVLEKTKGDIAQAILDLQS